MNKTALITGGAQRIGKHICQILHQAGYDIIIHYRNSKDQAEQLAEQLNQIRASSAHTLQADLNSSDSLTPLCQQIITQHPKLTLLINNASSFYPTPLGTATIDQWNDLFNSNVNHYI